MKYIIVALLIISNYVYANDRMHINDSHNESTIIIGQIQAVVNNNVITSNQVTNRLHDMVNMLNKKGTNLPTMKEMYKQVTEQLILEKIQLDLATSYHLDTTKTEVNDVIKRIASQNKMNESQFYKYLTQHKIQADDFKQQIADQITIDKLKQGVVNSRINVTDHEVQFVLNSELYKDDVSYDLSDIVVTIPSDSTSNVLLAKEKLIQEAYNQLQLGADFSTVAAKYSDASNATSGGNLGWKEKSSLPTNILNKISALVPGAYTDIINTPTGYFIFKLNQIHKYGDPQQIKQYHIKQILIKVGEGNSNDYAHHMIVNIKKLLDKVQYDSNAESVEFSKLALAYSQDDSSINGGDMGFVTLENMPPQFQQAVLNLGMLQISVPFRTIYGWHIIQVVDTRITNAPNNMQHLDIINNLRANQTDYQYLQWLHAIHDQAYIKINK
jgi:peptidyl-prolyl cis-trans isomerase SurA